MGQASGKEKGDSSTQTVDGGHLVPQGVYSAVQDYNHDVVQGIIKARKLAPFYQGLDDEDAYSEAPFNTECPICFLHYPSPLNQTRCCGQPICTECFVQIKRADPNHTNPPSSEPAACPYCMETSFGVIYKAPPPGLLTGEIRREAGTAEGASAARAQAEGSAEGSAAVYGKRRKSFGATDPEVVTIDLIRPDWEAKLQAAHAAINRRANRRIIMRQVGDRLIPVGVSSSRLGAELPPGSTTGPGGAIIIQDGARWGGLGRSGTGEGRSTTRSRRELAQLLQLGGGAEVEEMMMMEAMRLSLLEHEEQQRRQAQAQSREESSSSAGPAAGGGDVGNAPADEEAQYAIAPPTSAAAPATVSAPAATSTFTDSQLPSSMHPTRTSSLAAGPPLSAPIDLGLSSSMMAELSELIDGAPPRPPEPSEPSPSSPPSAQGLEVRQQPPSSSSMAGEPALPASGTNTPILPSSPTHTRQSSSLGQGVYGSSPSAPSTPSRVGTNPNNPFRRMAGGGSNPATPPNHSRQGSNF